MKTSVEKVNPTRVKVDVTIDEDELKPYKDQALKKAAAQVQIPGFRQGKAPAELVEQKIGPDYVISEVLNTNLNDFYNQVLQQENLQPLEVPQVEVNKLPDEQSPDLGFTFELEVRPEVDLPALDDIEITVDDPEVDPKAAEKALDDLLGRFASLKDVDRKAKKDDHVIINLTASIDGKEVDSAQDLSYEIGSGTMLEGLDEALIGLKPGESKTFETTLEGGEHSGEKSEVQVTLDAVKEREIPKADDEFAQLASEFDTMDELKAQLDQSAQKTAELDQGVQARDKLAEFLVDKVDVEIPSNLIDQQVEQQFEAMASGQALQQVEDTPDERKKMREDIEQSFKEEIILDALATRDDIEVQPQEIAEYIGSLAQQSGMDPNTVAQMLEQQGQIPQIFADIRRRKALANLLNSVKVVDKNGKDVDLSEFLGAVNMDSGAKSEGKSDKSAKKSSGKTKKKVDTSSGKDSKSTKTTTLQKKADSQASSASKKSTKDK